VNIPIIDTHQHLIYPDTGPYSWTRCLDALDGKPFQLDEYRRLAQPAGIVGSIFMETSPDDWHAELAHIVQLAARPGAQILGIVANCRPEEDGFEQYLESIRTEKLVGLRRICHTESDDLSSQPRFVQNVRRAGRLGLTFDLCFFARQLGIALELARKCPDMQFVLDHCGVPDIVKGAMDGWGAAIRDLASLPNVACKISGVLAYCSPENATMHAVRPWIEHCIESFGWDRVVWGSDWPVCDLRSSLPAWVEISRQIVQLASEDEQAKLFQKNALRLYGVQVPH
jgi:predicted TIM-barrel fold metal-dependent hydrolase